MISKTACLHLGRVLFSLSLFGFVFVYIDLTELVSVFSRGIDWFWIFVTIGIMFVERLLAVYKWKILLTAKEIFVPFWSLFLILMLGRFWGMFLPSSVSIDIVRGYYLYKATSRGALSAASLFVDKLNSVVALLFVAMIGLVFYGSQFTKPEITIYIVSLVVVSGIGIYILQHEDLAAYLESWTPTLFGNKLSGVIANVHRSFLDYKQLPLALLISFLLSLLFQIVKVVAFYIGTLVLHIDVPFNYFLIFVPVMMILVMVPVSVGGFGVREGSMVALFGLAGLSTTDAFAIAFVSSILDTLLSLLGGVIYLFGWSPKSIRDHGGPPAFRRPHF